MAIFPMPDPLAPVFQDAYALEVTVVTPEGRRIQMRQMMSSEVVRFASPNCDLVKLTLHGMADSVATKIE